MIKSPEYKHCMQSRFVSCCQAARSGSAQKLQNRRASLLLDMTFSVQKPAAMWCWSPTLRGPSSDVYSQLERLGVQREAFDSIVPSGDVTGTLAKDRPGALLFHFDPARDHTILNGVTNTVVGISDAKLCLLTAPLDDAIETVDVYHDLLAKMRDNAVEMICANPDLVV